MRPILLIFATREGHTRHLAERLAQRVEARRFPVELHDARAGGPLRLEDYSAAVLAGSVHQEKHEKELVRFVQAQRDALSRMPTVFLSVSLSQAGAEDPAATQDYRQGSSRDAAEMIEHSCEQTSWRPGHAHAIAGALPYTRYSPLLRFVMKRIASRAGASTDTSRDHVYSDWGALERVVDEIAEAVGPPPGSRELEETAPQP